MLEGGFFAGASRDRAIQLGGENFSLTVAALRMSRIANAVSQLHGLVANKMWEWVEDRCPIRAITNAVNLQYWQDKRVKEAQNDPELNKPPSELPDYSSVNSFLCPITKNIMKNPVITPYGTTYDKDAIISWLKTNETCPLTKKPLNRKMLIPNYALKNAITRYLESTKI